MGLSASEGVAHSDGGAVDKAEVLSESGDGGRGYKRPVAGGGGFLQVDHNVFSQDMEGRHQLGDLNIVRWHLLDLNIDEVLRPDDGSALPGVYGND